MHTMLLLGWPVASVVACSGPVGSDSEPDVAPAVGPHPDPDTLPGRAH